MTLLPPNFRPLRASLAFEHPVVSAYSKNTCKNHDTLNNSIKSLYQHTPTSQKSEQRINQHTFPRPSIGSPLGLGRGITIFTRSPAIHIYKYCNGNEDPLIQLL